MKFKKFLPSSQMLTCDQIRSQRVRRFNLGPALCSAGLMQGRQMPQVIPECAPVRDVLCDMKINFLRLYQPSYQKEKWGGREKRILGIECLPVEAKLNPNLLNSRNLCSIFIISVAWIERMATGQGGHTHCHWGEPRKFWLVLRET